MMNKWMYAYLAIGLLLLAAPAGALVPDTITIETDHVWVTAGGPDAATLTVQVSNSASDNTPFAGVAVNLAVDNTYGSISPARVVTDADGKATAVFTPGTHSGTATITATATYAVGEETISLTGSVNQQVDHAAPAAVASLWYEPEVTVGEQTNITVRMVDCYGNIVDSRNVAENVVFMVGSPSGNAVFVDGTDEITVPVDAVGNATATLQVDTVAGENLVYIQPTAPVKSDYIALRGVADGEPHTIDIDVQPDEGDPPYVYAGSNSRFLLTYTLLDEYGNPSPGKVLVITTSVSGEGETRVTTNALGQAQVSYGPWIRAGDVIITATAVSNPSVTHSQPLAFVISTPTSLFLSTSRQTMPSRDVPGCEQAEIRAKLVDQYNNPIPGKVVSFRIQDIDSGTYNQTQGPEFTVGGVIAGVMTDANGVATIGFWPGYFTTGWRAPGYSPDATGTCKLIAEYGGLSREMVLTWKNYPYLTVETDVTPEAVVEGETVDVTIRLKGDGWALPRYEPIDVVILLDRGEGMLLNDGNKTDNDDRMIYARAAAEDFARYIDTDIGHWQNNRVGLAIYGDKPTCPPYTDNKIDILNLPENYNWAKDVGKDGNPSQDTEYVETHYPGNGKIWYEDYADLLNNLIPGNSPAIHDSLWNVVPMKNNYQGNPSAPLRYGLYKAIKMLEGTPPTSEDSVRAIVVLMQSRYSYYGSPFGPDAGGAEVSDPAVCGPDSNNYVPFDDLGDQQNLAKYAQSQGVQIFPIYYTGSGSQAQEDVPRLLASESGGEYFFADNHTALEQAFAAIAEMLKTEAGVNTAMNVVFKDVEVNGAPVPGDQVFDYVYAPLDSTRIYSYFSNNSTVITGPYGRDDTQNWTASPPHLPFEIGTVHVNQVWEATFRLRVLTDGNLNVFGSGSIITFNDGKDVLRLPDTFITVTASNNTGMDIRSLDISNLRFTGAEPVSEFLPVAWDLNYTGLYDATEEVFYSNDNEYTWVKFDTLHATNTTSTGESTLDVRDLPAGIYIIQVHGYAPDTEDASARLVQEVASGASGGAYIRIQ